MQFLSKMLIASAIICSGVHIANAGVIIGGTRVIYDGNKKEASIGVNNPDNVPYLIQSWIETQSGVTEKNPFIITPPLYRLDQGQKNVERIILTAPLPQGKESLYWLNIKAIPSTPKETGANTLQIAVKTRIKLIYRPSSLKDSSPEEQADKLTWRSTGNLLQVMNPTPYVMNFNEIMIGGKKVEDVTFVLPGSTVSFPLPKGITRGDVTFKVINDYGGPGELHRNNI